ncbi:MAG: metallophosphatase family protein [Chloroflexi bacterium]|nr:metallophosphatase family protein [Chloroflexota bacterium]
MRILIFSDLHANLEALSALHQVEQPPDALFFLGDAVGYGPDPTACVAWLRASATRAVCGDHDHATVTHSDFASPPEYVDLAIATREHTLRQLKPAALAYLAALPTTALVEMGGARFFLAHGSPRAPLARPIDLMTSSDDTLRAELEGVEADVVLLGHTHVPSIRRVDNTHIVNPGSLGQPRHGLPSATYAVWEDGQLQIKHIDYDPRPTQFKLNLMSLDPEVAERLSEILQKGL